MCARTELFDEELDNVNGGQITYTWNGTIGSIGLNGNNPYVLLDKAAFLNYYMQEKENLTECTILKNLLAMGIIKVPD